MKKTFYKAKKAYPAVNGVSFSVSEGSCVGIVGESGCGKSTTARMITHLTKPDAGSVLLYGQEMVGAGRKQRRELYKNVQMVIPGHPRILLTPGAVWVTGINGRR